MDKKYELIETGRGWHRIKALKDFTLITGEIIKKDDVGGYVRSEDCLSHEGNCWIMNDAVVCGKVSGNAVVKDFAKVYGVAFGNAIVKDYTRVSADATVTGNAMVQAFQHITYGTVTTNLLGTKDWEAALYAELGIVPKNGKIILYKKTWRTNGSNVFESNHNSNFIYEIGKKAVETNVDEDVMKSCAAGLHFTTLEFIDKWSGETILECEINVKDIVTVQENKVRARKCRVIKTIEGEEQWIKNMN